MVGVDTHICTCGLCYVLLIVGVVDDTDHHGEEVRCCNHFCCSVLNRERERESDEREKENVVINVYPALDIRERFDDDE